MDTSTLAIVSLGVTTTTAIGVGFGAVVVANRLTRHATRDEAIAAEQRRELADWRAEVNGKLDGLRTDVAELTGIVKWVRPDLDEQRRPRAR